MLSFRTEQEISNESVESHLYKYVSKQLNELDAKQLNLTGISEQSLGKWISHERQKELSKECIYMIRQMSAGFPSLLKEWIPLTIMKSTGANIVRMFVCEEQV